MKPRAPEVPSRLTEVPAATRPPPPPRPAAPARPWQPFRFSTLERVSKRQAQLLRTLEWVLPGLPAGEDATQVVQRKLQELLEEPVSLQLEAVYLAPGGSLKEHLGEPTFLAVLASAPHQARTLLEVELPLAHRAIELMLGGAGEAVGLRPLTDLEEGMLTYVVLETLKVLGPGLDPGLPRLRLESVARGHAEVAGLPGEDERLAVVQLRAAFGAQGGTVRLFLPETLVAQAAPPGAAPARRARRRAAAKAHAARLAGVRAPARVEVGLVEIAAGELDQVQEGDVILVDRLTFRPGREEAGTARLKLGLARGGCAELAVRQEAGRVTATVTGFSGPPPEDPGEPQSTPEGVRARSSVESDADGSDLMNDIPLQLSVELARLSITAEEVLAMKVGQVFDLDRTSASGLDLSVNGRVVGRGELVEIDGNLGVRIVSLAG